MKKQIAKRFLELIVLLIVLSMLTFLLMYLAPGDPAEKRLSSQGVAVTREGQVLHHPNGDDRDEVRQQES